ncbi:hypothetical protein BC835DRAFT_1066395 [Cytidiella melzeri]|nr:hypothetical protein BC835DRAFT_1066395 [Cytidiella melzeri]
MTTSFEVAVGPLLVCVCIAFILFGTFIAQLYYYYLTYGGDSTALKVYVSIVGVLETCHTIFCMVFLYGYLVTHFGDQKNGIDRVSWGILATVVFEIAIVVMAQLLYAWRIWHVSNKNIILTAIPTILAFLRFCFGFVSFGLLAPLVSWDQLPSHETLHGILTTTYAIELVADATITVFLVYSLMKRQATTRVKQTQDIVQKLVFYILNTGVANIVCSAAVIIMFNILPESLAFAGIIEMRSKLYANIMMALLNARHILFNGRDLEVHSTSRPRETRVHIYTNTIIQDDSNGLTQHDEDHKGRNITADNNLVPLKTMNTGVE